MNVKCLAGTSVAGECKMASDEGDSSGPKTREPKGTQLDHTCRREAMWRRTQPVDGEKEVEPMRAFERILTPPAAGSHAASSTLHAGLSLSPLSPCWLSPRCLAVDHFPPLAVSFLPVSGSFYFVSIGKLIVHPFNASYSHSLSLASPLSRVRTT